jgi:phosphoglycerate dehydrogenase-like enzyme
MGLVRIGTGRDAADVAFATVFGGVQTSAPMLRAIAVDEPVAGFILPHHRSDAISTDRQVGDPLEDYVSQRTESRISSG